MDGWISLYRKIVENPMYFEEPFTKIQAWIDLLIMAEYKSRDFHIRGNKIIVGRGQIAMSTENLSKRWRWSNCKVVRFLNRLENAQQIRRQKSKLISLISIVNYDIYQTGELTERITNELTDELTNELTDELTSNNINNINNNIKEKPPKGGKKKTDAVASPHTPLPFSDRFILFQDWLKDKAPNVSKMQYPFTEKEVDKLYKDFPRELIKKIILNMHNYKELNKKNVSANLTFRKWADKEDKKQDSSKSKLQKNLQLLQNE